MSDIEELLAQCLKEIEEGSSVEECLARHPDCREELAPLLRTAQRMRAAPRVSPPPTFRRHARTRLLNTIEAQISAARPQPSVPPRQRGLLRRLGLTMPAMVTIMVIVLLVTAGLGVVHASSRSLPGDPLYEVKLAIERIRLTLSPTQAGVARAHLAVAERRLEEAARLSETDGEEEIEILMVQYMEQVRAANEVLQARRLRDDQVAPLAEHLQDRLTHHQEVLEQVRARVPEEAQVGIDQAWEASQKAREQVDMFLDKPGGPPPERPPHQGPPSHAPGVPQDDDPSSMESPPEPRPTVSPSPQTEESDGEIYPGHARTPQRPGRLITPQRPEQTATPPAADSSENGASKKEKEPIRHPRPSKDDTDPAEPAPTAQPTSTKVPASAEESKPTISPEPIKVPPESIKQVPLTEGLQPRGDSDPLSDLP